MFPRPNVHAGTKPVGDHIYAVVRGYPCNLQPVFAERARLMFVGILDDEREPFAHAVEIRTGRLLVPPYNGPGLHRHLSARAVDRGCIHK